MAKDNPAEARRRKLERPRRETTFVRASTYRQRRLRDASRLLPFAGLALMLLPFYLPIGTGPAAHLSYLLLLWTGLVGVAFLLARGFDRDPGEGA